jgi:hypothetical protein
MEQWCYYIDGGRLKDSEENVFQYDSFTTNPTWTDLDVNLGLYGEKPVTVNLSL